MTNYCNNDNDSVPPKELSGFFAPRTYPEVDPDDYGTYIVRRWKNDPGVGPFRTKAEARTFIRDDKEN